MVSLKLYVVTNTNTNTNTNFCLLKPKHNKINTNSQWMTNTRFVKTFPCVAAYMSSLAIIAVAIDRWKIITIIWNSKKNFLSYYDALACLHSSSIKFLIDCYYLLIKYFSHQILQLTSFSRHRVIINSNGCQVRIFCTNLKLKLSWRYYQVR